MAPGGRSAGLRLRAVASHLRSCPANSSEAQPSADTALLDGAGQMAAEVLQPMSPSATTEEIVEALKTVGCALVPSVITPATAARLGEILAGYEIGGPDAREDVMHRDPLLKALSSKPARRRHDGWQYARATRHPVQPRR